MNYFITKLNKDLNSQLQDIDLEEPDLIRKSQRSILCVRDTLTQLKAYTIQHTFCNAVEETLFFKKIKPELFSKLIYYVNILNIESSRPVGSREIQEIYLRQELEKLSSFFNNNLEFYQYYRMGSTYLDDKYFMRGKEGLHVYENNLMFYIDPDFSTSHDYIVSEIIANDQLKVFLNIEIQALYINNGKSQLGTPWVF
jgi:hypothetical protein